MTSLGTHNLLDGEGDPTPFADYLFFTEADPQEVREVLEPLGYVVVPCRWQKDLVIAWRQGTFEPKRDRKGRVKQRYMLAHPGIRKVTPHRGSFWIPGKDGSTLFDEHRINAAFAPWIRGEKWIRSKFWALHTKISVRIIRRRKKKGDVFAGGDPNAPRGVKAYRGELFEVGEHLDRLGSTRRLTDVKVWGKKNSDHFRLRASTLRP